MILTRRRLLQMTGAVAGLATAAGSTPAAPAAARKAEGSTKRIGFVNLHTAETLDVEFFRDGAYVPGSFVAIQKVLRDFRTDQQHPMDPELMDYLHAVAGQLRVDPLFGVIAGFRSPQTNRLPLERSSGCARRSLHPEGRAIDVRVAGVDCAKLAQRALGLACGGVGYYRSADFVHLDTGAVRTWNG